MAKHDRNLLSIHAVEAFATFATNMGAKVRPGKGAFQLLQVKTVGPDWYAICKNDQAVVTTPPSLRELIKQFKERKVSAVADRTRDEVICLNPRNDLAQALPQERHAKTAPARPLASGESAELYAADLRDDAAVEFMSALALKHSDPSAMTDAQMAALAKTAYRMADALLVAGGHA